MISFALITMAVSLGIDTLSLSLIPASSKLKTYEIVILAIIIGFFNFIMILIGFFFGGVIIKFIPFPHDILISLILLYMGVSMIIDYHKNRHSKKYFFKLILLAFISTIDSISLGLSFGNTGFNNFLFSCIFATMSFIFTFIGLYISRFIIDNILSDYKLLGGIILMGIGLIHFFL